ncbi:MAG: hypothetical protein JWM58_1838 [Rhizobium sp.]|nr:hypothetical protein [Rhizobium sp.]
MLTTERPIESFMMRGQSGGVSQSPGGFPRTNGPSEIWELIWRYKGLLAVIIVGGTLISLIIAMSLTEFYTATSAIVFDRNDTRPYEAVVEAQKQERDKSTMDTEFDIITSRIFIGVVVDALKLTEDPFYNTYLPAGEIPSDSWLRSRLSSLVKFVVGTKADEQKALKARMISQNAQRDRAISTLLNTFTVDRKGDSLALSIKVQQTNPTQAAVIANKLAEHYVAWTSSLKAVATRDTVSYLRKTAADLAISIASREREIASFTENSDLTFDPKDDLLRARMEQLNEQFTLARVDEAGARAKVNEGRERLASIGENGVGKIFTSELLTNLRTEEARLQRLLAQLTSKFGKNHPLVVDAAAELSSNRKMLDDEVQRLLQTLQSDAEVATIRVERFEHEVALLQKRIQSRNLAEIRRREFERDLLSEQKRYDAISLRLGSLDPKQEEVKATAMIASYAEVPVQPSFPQPVFVIGAGFVGSLMLAVVFMLIRHSVDDRLYRPEAVAELLNRPNLVSIPNYRKGRASLSDPYRTLLRNPDSPYARAIRTLCLAWRTIDNSAGEKVVMFASTSVGDGKTTLSLSMAAMGKSNGFRTVVIDLNPSPRGAASISGVRGTEGAIDGFLEGRCDIGAIVVPSPNYPFLDMVVVPQVVRDYDRLFSALRNEYDLIIVDTMAIEESDDAVWLSSHVDSIFVVVSSGRTKQRRLGEMIQRFNLNRALLVGGITNFFGKPQGWTLSARKRNSRVQPTLSVNVPAE